MRALSVFTYFGAFGALVLCVACGGPKDATPFPQPPAGVAPTDLHFPAGAVISGGGEYEPAVVLADPGSATPGASIIATNLDTRLAPVWGTVEADGSIEIVVEVNGFSITDEIRFQLETDSGRSEPTDVVLGRMSISPVPRLDCLTITPGLDLLFAAEGSQELTLTNDCNTSITVDNQRARLGLADFTTDAAPAVELAPEQKVTFNISFERSAGGHREDILLIDVTEASTFRYAITLRSEP